MKKNRKKETSNKRHIITIILMMILCLIVVIGIWKICETLIFSKQSSEINNNGQNGEKDPTYYLEKPFLWEENEK